MSSSNARERMFWSSMIRETKKSSTLIISAPRAPDSTRAKKMICLARFEYNSNILPIVSLIAQAPIGWPEPSAITPRLASGTVTDEKAIWTKPLVRRTLPRVRGRQL